VIVQQLIMAKTDLYGSRGASECGIY